MFHFSQLMWVLTVTFSLCFILNYFLWWALVEDRMNGSGGSCPTIWHFRKIIMGCQKLTLNSVSTIIFTPWTLYFGQSKFSYYFRRLYQKYDSPWGLMVGIDGSSTTQTMAIIKIPLFLRRNFICKTLLKYLMNIMVGS